MVWAIGLPLTKTRFHTVYVRVCLNFFSSVLDPTHQSVPGKLKCGPSDINMTIKFIGKQMSLIYSTDTCAHGNGIEVALSFKGPLTYTSES